MQVTQSTLRIALIGLIALAIAVGIGRFAFTPLLPMMQADGLASIADGGLLASVHFAGYWIGAIVAYWVSVAPKSLLRWSLLGIAAFTLAMGLTENFLIWLALRFVNGVLSAWTLVLISNYCVRTLAQSGQARYEGWVFAGVGTGIAVVGLLCLGFMAGGLSSGTSWMITGFVALVVVGLIVTKLGDEFPDIPVNAVRASNDTRPLNWTVVLAYGAAGIGYIIPATYLPVMARDAISSPLIFGASWPVFGIAALVSTIIAARLQQQMSNRQLWAARATSVSPVN